MLNWPTAERCRPSPTPRRSFGRWLPLLCERGFELLLVDVEHQAPALGVDAERVPRNHEEALADAEHAAAREERIGDAPGGDIDHHVAQASELGARAVHDGTA